jgi:hypothetical protein
MLCLAPQQDAFNEDMCRKMRTTSRNKIGKDKQIKLYNIIATATLMYRAGSRALNGS